MNDSPDGPQGFGVVWLERGIAAAKAGRRSEARESLFRALNDEAQREAAWLWLAAVSDDPRQEQMYLEKVLELNPDNHHAQAGMAQLARRGLKDLPSLSPNMDDRGNDGSPAQQVSASLEIEAEEAEQSASEVQPAAIVAPPPVVDVEDESELPVPEASTATAVEAEPVVEEPSPERQREPLGSATHVESDSIWPDESRELESLASAGEPTGWTTNTPVVEKRVYVERPRVERAVNQGPAASTVRPQYPDAPDYAPVQPVHRQVRRPAPQWRRLVHSEGQLSAIVNEAFNNHEMWTILASTVGLILLAFVIAFFFALRLI